MRPIPSLALTLLVLAATAGAQSQTSTLEERMSQAQFRAAGLDKLSPEQLHYLDGWLQAHPGTTIKYVNSSGGQEFYPHASERTPVKSHLAGTFTGWRGETVFTLDNGQQWKQAESGQYDAGKFTKPEVKIKPMILGSWLMYVEGCGCSVRVERIK